MISDTDYETYNNNNLCILANNNNNKNKKISTDSNENVGIFLFQLTDEIKNEGNNYYTDSSSDTESDEGTPNKTSLKKILKKPKQTPLSKRFKIIKGNPITDLNSLIYSLEHPKSTKFQKDFVDVLKELNGLIGMEKFKEQLIEQLLFFIQDYQEPGMFLHTVLLGSPGSGKTTVCKILGKIYSKLGILSSDKVIVADRSSLIAKYLGQTAIKTKEVLKSAKGGVLLLDEVYALGNKDGGDSFSKECIDTINQYLSENVEDFICVIAGYKDQVQECFFNQNPGLERRFPWKFIMEDYNEKELCQILKTQLDNKWEIDVEDSYIIDKIKNNKEYFKGNGGDTKNLLDKCKMAYSRRMFTEPCEQPTKKLKCSGRDINKIINKQDFNIGFENFLESKGRGNKKEISYLKDLYI